MKTNPEEIDRGVTPMKTSPEEIDRHVANRIRARRRMLGITQQHLADRIGVAFQQTHKYERGHNRITAGRLFQIAKALDTTIDYFFSDDEAKGSGHKGSGH